MSSIITEKQIVILGAGTAGTIIANKLSKHRKKSRFELTIIDQNEDHYYQPGLLFLPFDQYPVDKIKRKRSKYLPPSVTYIQKTIQQVDTDNQQVLLQDSSTVPYDLLIIATGSQIAPHETPGMEAGWHTDIFDFYTLDGAFALREKLKDWSGGKLVVHITEMPIKCPVAPLEFAFLADDFFKQKGLRDRVELTFVTPLSGAFTKPIATEKLGYLLQKKGIVVIPDFSVERIDNQVKKLFSYDEIDVDYDLLVTIPTNMGDPMIGRSGLGDDLNFVPTHPHTLQSKQHPNIFVIGDATDVQTSKAGSVAHFQAETLEENVLHFLEDEPLAESFDGHANCFVETGDSQGLLLDFNYDVEPLEGTFPLPIIGPLKLLKESRFNHWGKIFFPFVYWHLLLRGRQIPGISNKLSLVGKKQIT